MGECEGGGGGAVPVTNITNIIVRYKSTVGRSMLVLRGLGSGFVGFCEHLRLSLSTSSQLMVRCLARCGTSKIQVQFVCVRPDSFLVEKDQRVLSQRGLNDSVGMPLLRMNSVHVTMMYMFKVLSYRLNLLQVMYSLSSFSRVFM